MNQTRARTTVGTNTGSWAPTHRSEADIGLAAVSLNECRGADLPRMAFTHLNPFDPTKVEPARNDRFCKPAGGLWLSPYVEDGRTAWSRYGERARFARARDGVATEVALAADARVLVIDSREDFVNAIEAHSYVYENELNRNDDTDKRLLDFEAIAREYDAVWVTGRGVEANQIPPRQGRPVLGPWDIPTVLVFNVDALAPEPGCTSTPPTHTSAP